MRTMGADIEVEDTVFASLEYEHGALGIIECTTAARPLDFEASISIVGEKGLAQIGGIAVKKLEVFTQDPKECDKNSENFEGLEGKGAVYGYGHFKIYEDIVSHYNRDQEYPINEEECMKTLRLLESFYKSHEVNDWMSVSDGSHSKNLGRPNEEISNLYRTPKV